MVEAETQQSSTNDLPATKTKLEYLDFLSLTLLPTLFIFATNHDKTNSTSSIISASTFIGNVIQDISYQPTFQGTSKSLVTTHSQLVSEGSNKVFWTIQFSRLWLAIPEIKAYNSDLQPQVRLFIILTGVLVVFPSKSLVVM